MSEEVRIWIWIQDSKLYKAIYNPNFETLTILNENDEVIIKRRGIKKELLKKIEIAFSCIGAKRIDGSNEPFTIL